MYMYMSHTLVVFLYVLAARCSHHQAEVAEAMGQAVASPVVARHMNGSSASNATAAAVGHINGNLGHQRNQVTHELGCAEQELREMQLEKAGMVAELERLDTGSHPPTPSSLPL